MPYKSEKQRRFMYAVHPDIAARWDREGKNYIQGQGGDLPAAKERLQAEAKRRVKKRSRAGHGLTRRHRVGRKS